MTDLLTPDEVAMTAAEEAKFRESVRLLGADDYALHWSNNAMSRLLATLDRDRPGHWTDERQGADDEECDRLGCEDKTHPVHHWVLAPAAEALEEALG
jgi:hypothetical protein